MRWTGLREYTVVCLTCCSLDSQVTGIEVIAAACSVRAREACGLTLWEGDGNGGGFGRGFELAAEAGG